MPYQDTAVSAIIRHFVSAEMLWSPKDCSGLSIHLGNRWTGARYIVFFGEASGAGF
jgi:hypothetical protein